MSNPIHSTSAKSVLPMLAMRGLATGLCAGCVVGLLRLSHDRAAARVALWLEEWREVWWTVPIWFGVLVALAVILRRIVREEPLISGSGIPQTELALAGRLSFTWWRVLLAKFLGSWLALFGGLALGREGPSIQMGGAVGAGFHALWRPAAPHALTGSPYVVAGAVAGLAAAFGAPAAGVLFAFEEMKSRRDTSLIVAACRRLHAPAEDPTHIDKLALIFGTEGDGLSHHTIARADLTVKIPMSHGVDSLNVAASSAVAFYATR